MRLEFRGLYQSSYKQILIELGGIEQIPSKNGPTQIEGPGWTAELEPEDRVSFSKAMVIPRTFITFSGDPESVTKVVSLFRLRALRGGG